MNESSFKRNMTLDDAGVSGRNSSCLHNEVEGNKKVLKPYKPDVYGHDGKVIAKYDDKNEGSVPKSLSRFWRKQQ